MVRVVYGAPTKFKYIAQALAKINDEALMVFTPEELVVWLMSPDKVSLAILHMPPLSFEEYSVDAEARYRFRTDEFNKVVKRATRNDLIIIESDPEMGGIRVVLEDKKTGVTRTFSITSSEEMAEELKEPRFEPTTRFALEAKDFKTLTQDAKVVGDIIEFKSSEEEVVARVEGEEKDYEWHMQLNNPLLSLEVEEPSESSYSRAVLEAAAKPTGAAEEVKVEYASQYPMRIEYTFPNSERLYIYIAPSIE